jgi:hypothetical protein
LTCSKAACVGYKGGYIPVEGYYFEFESPLNCIKWHCRYICYGYKMADFRVMGKSCLKSLICKVHVFSDVKKRLKKDE